MRINDFDGMPKGFYEPSSDQFNRADMDDTRKDRLTLKDLNRLKKLRAFKKLEDLKRQDSLELIYGQGDGEDGGGGDMGL